MRDVIGQLKALDIGAEAFPAGLYERIREQNADVYIMNGYGPTETTISCTMSVIDGSGCVTIGTPNSNVKVAVADEAGHALPMGALGELVILGEGVGRGYQNRDDLTKKSFIRFWGRPAYRSGDLARILPDGEIEFKGCRDNQVKLRGFRVELDEIENVIRRFPGVRLAKVVVRNNGAEDYLVGFFTADADRAVSVPEMTEFLRKSLAAYMVPDVMQRIDEMPLTVNGKIDAKRLPDVRFQRAMAAYEPPANALERALCDKFAEILKLERVGANDDFFEIGGTSLSAMIVVSAAAAQGWNLVYKNIFEYATPRALAAYIAKKGAEAAGKEEKAAAETAKKAEEGPDDLLKYNGVEFLNGIRTAPPGKVLRTGATGFLGIHMLRELIRPEGAESVVCMVRDKGKLDARKRIEALLEYYFNDTFEAELSQKVRIVRADVNDADLAEKLADCAFDAIINCAAMVKHFARDDSIERVNVGGVRNMIEVALEKNARLIQVSTESVAGYSVNGSVPLSRVFTEKDMDIGQTTGTRYTKSKLQAEKDILAAARDRGLRAKIMRVGNLMSRRKDGEFQINFHTNNFMNSLRAYVALGCFPVDDMDSPVEFSPIDSVSRALMLLSGTPDRYTVFHVDNCHVVHMANILEALADCGMPLEVTSAAEFGKRLDQMLKDERRSLEVSSLVSYRTDGDDTYRSVEVSNAYTVKALYRLGFSWPVITPEYMERAIMALKGLGFFDS
ncbi:MAG: SDR family oxidoreductase [Clostridia bacterium]|nr:SDR family oxidoreductase [Clostridia bacterium]